MSGPRSRTPRGRHGASTTSTPGEKTARRDDHGSPVTAPASPAPVARRPRATAGAGAKRRTKFVF